MIHPPLKICSQGEGKSEPHIGRTKEVKSMMKAGDRFIIDPLVCEDEDVLEWYENQPEKVLTAEHVEPETNGVWAKGCPYRINLDETEKVL